MPTCNRCGSEFEVDDAREEYDAKFHGDPEYDDQYEGDVCGSCAVDDSESLMNKGLAIDMMNGDADYDDKHVEQWL